MKNQNICETLMFLRPNAQFTLTGDSIQNLNWLDKEQEKPTETEIEEGWIAYQAKVAEDKAIAEAKKATAQAKLQALGLTADDLTALGLGGN